MNGHDPRFSVLLTTSAGLTLLWYKRVMIAIGPDQRLVFLPCCGLGFLAVALALDWGRLGWSNRTVILAGFGGATAATALALVPGPARWAGLALAGFTAGVAFYTILFVGLRALPQRRRGWGFASIFMLAGAINTTCDLPELPWLKVAGTGPNLVMAAVCLVLAGAVVACQGWRFNLRLARAQPSQTGGLRSVMAVGGLAVVSFLLLFILLALHESVAYPTAVTSVGSSGFIRYVELPAFWAAAWLTDRVGRQAVILGSLALALVGATGLAASANPTVATISTCCVVGATLAFPVACCALIADVMCYAVRPALLGCLSFAPVVVGQLVEGLVRPGAERLTPGALFGWSLGLAAVWTAVTLVLLELIRINFAALRAAAALIEAADDPAWSVNVELAARQAGLTRREVEVFVLSAAGRTVRQIAAELFVTEATVKFHITNMLRKTGTGSRAELTRSLLGERAAAVKSASTPAGGGRGDRRR
ncbi:MAG: LuxR C-terminal-related transcriptional regulator [Propionibacteriaceae bacterium]|jgi:DNA-binding CsgD family transcriptional regulator|nr:LuxR C-terminal-related transcriptional regulator [Propionibacteriaceae bacterium]